MNLLLKHSPLSPFRGQFMSKCSSSAPYLQNSSPFSDPHPPAPVPCLRPEGLRNPNPAPHFTRGETAARERGRLRGAGLGRMQMREP